jgi:glycosyltransferase involved in cell wall biosynthesis
MVETMNNISLVLATYQANIPLLQKALDCSHLFNEVVLHINDKVTGTQICIPKNCKVIYKEEKCSIEEALNDAIQLAKGEWILPFTDDDYFHPENLNFLFEFIKSNYANYDVVHYPIWAGNEKSGWRVWGKESEIDFNNLLEHNYLPFSSVYRKSVWENVGGYKHDIPFSDWYFWLEVVRQNYKFYYLNNPIYYHREGHKITLANKQANQFNIMETHKLFKSKLGI